MDKKAYYDIHPIMKMGYILTFITGARSCGKTYSAKCFLIEEYLKNGKEFAWIRRYKSECKGPVNAWSTFFDDIKANNPELLKGHKCEIKGKECLIDGKRAGSLYFLSASTQTKGIAAPEVYWIVFDEVILQPGDTIRYIGENETDTFFQLVSTLVRDRQFRVILLSNNLNAWNPYYITFGFRPDLTSELEKYTHSSKNKNAILEHIKNTIYEKEMKETSFGALIKGTNYEKMAIGNEDVSSKDTDAFIVKKLPEKLIPSFCITVDGKTLGIWYDRESGKYYFRKKYDPSKVNYVFSNADHNINTVWLGEGKKDGVYKFLLNRYKYGEMFFDCIESQKKFELLLEAFANFRR